MSGVTTPTNPILRPFGNAALGPSDPGGAVLPIPVASQIGVLPGAASFTDGFPPATMVDPEADGGVPPFGQDMNGLLYMITAYCAMLQAGQLVNWNDTAQTAFGGYAIGAQVASIAAPGRVWTNWVDGNPNDPDVDPTGWAANDPQLATLSPTAGTYHDVVLPGVGDYALDIDTTDGNVDYGGFVAQRNGQKLFISNTGPNLVQILANSGGDAADNRVRAPSDLAIVQNQTLTIQYFTALSRWLLI